MSSPEQLTANRLNAQKSTGPKTEIGKTFSKLNALKHGLLARTLLVRSQTYRESRAEFTRVSEEFHASLAPQGPLEKMLVDQIVQASWRLRRARTAENGEIALSVDEGRWERQRVPLDEQFAVWQGADDPVREMEHSKIGNSLLAVWLRRVRDRVEEEGVLSKATIKIPLNGRVNRLSDQLGDLRVRCEPPPKGADPVAHAEQTKRKLLAQIDKKIRMYEWRKKKCERRDRSTEQARQSAAVLPGAAALDKIMRYEAALERQIFRAMNHLERLQRGRQGEIIPAPLTVELSPGI